jgi:hypothetical protein
VESISAYHNDNEGGTGEAATKFGHNLFLKAAPVSEAAYQHYNTSCPLQNKLKMHMHSLHFRSFFYHDFLEHLWYIKYVHDSLSIIWLLKSFSSFCNNVTSSFAQ